MLEMFCAPVVLLWCLIYLKEQSPLPECKGLLQWERTSLANKGKGARFGTGSREYNRMESRSQVCT